MQRNICKHGRALLPWRFFETKKYLRLHPTQENAACVEMWRCFAPFSVDFLSPPPLPPPLSPQQFYDHCIHTRGDEEKEEELHFFRGSGGEILGSLFSVQSAGKRENIASGGYRSGAVPFRRSLFPFFAMHASRFPTFKSGAFKTSPFFNRLV